MSDNFGQRYVEQFFAVYDISKDDKKVEYYQLLDESFDIATAANKALNRRLTRDANLHFE